MLLASWLVNANLLYVCVCVCGGTLIMHVPVSCDVLRAIIKDEHY